MGATDRQFAFRTEILAASKVPTNPVRCPLCSCEDLVLYGQVAFPHRETRKGGIVIDKVTDTEIAENFELASMDCLGCSVRFEIQSDAEAVLCVQVSQLREKFRELTGKDPYGESKPC
jgi:hypothetical protein